VTRGPALALWLLVAALALGACGPRTTTTVASPRTPLATEPPSAEHLRLLALVNEVRASGASCGAEGVFPPSDALSLDGRLTAAAQRHAEELRRLGRISHIGADGSTVADRAELHGYDWRSVGENVASGFESPEGVVSGWLGSDGHCANIMHAGYVHLGIGRDGGYWTQVFGRPR
jgi:uncharacterized protein YkwD